MADYSAMVEILF